MKCTQQTLRQQLVLQEDEEEEDEEEDRYKSLVPMCYRGARIAIAGFDVTYPSSLSVTFQCLDELRQHAFPDLVIVFVGNKIDLVDQRPAITDEVSERLRSLGTARLID